MNPTPSLNIRQARLDELPWINEQYDQIGFVQSKLPEDFVAIAEWDGVKAGLGRVVRIDLSTAELGGMFVSTPFRGRGIAEKIVRFLLEKNDSYTKIFCLPFSHLSSFYSQFGFRSDVSCESVPKEVQEKHRWCNQKYPQPTLLFSLTKSPK